MIAATLTAIFGLLFRTYKRQFGAIMRTIDEGIDVARVVVDSVKLRGKEKRPVIEAAEWKEITKQFVEFRAAWADLRPKKKKKIAQYDGQ